jgi:5-methyltetrahydropteroyltriglutamate--homocysteine methyltransferase
LAEEITKQASKRRIKMIGCYVTGILPRPKELVEATRAYERRRIGEEELEKAFREATIKAIEAQLSAGLSYITDGMLKWQDLLRPFTENLEGIKAGALARWFNNNTFYRKPIVQSEIRHKKAIVPELTYMEYLPKGVPWKAILPAPYTLARLSENKFYKNEGELMFSYADVLKIEIESLTGMGFKYVQLSDPALVYNPLKEPVSGDTLADVKEALKIVVKNGNVRTCLQTFFGDFSQILPEALDFPVDDLGIDLYETSLEKLEEHAFNKGVALGLVDARSSLIEDENELFTVAKELIESIYPSKIHDVFICPNCDLEFLPWERAEEKIRVISRVAKRLKAELGIHG